MATIAIVALSFSVVVGRGDAASSRWSISATPPTPFDTRIEAISCSTAAFCMAVGQASGAGASGTFVESLVDTTWSVVPSPSPTSESDLRGVACLSETNCLAVGTARDPGGGRYHPLIESWNGNQWSVAPSPPANKQGTVLNSVSCVSATSCVAVGDSGSNLTDPFSEVWDGNLWTIAKHVRKVQLGLLAGVSCTTDTNCIAVGDLMEFGANSLIEQWNGSTWSVVDGVSPSGDRLFGVSCAAPACIAVGTYRDSSGVGFPLVDTWDGTAWSRVVAPTPVGAVAAGLFAVSCASATHCVAVGASTYLADGIYSFATLIEVWNGAVWEIVKSPNPPGGGATLYGTSCTGRRTCTAIGYGESSGPDAQTFALVGH